MVSFLQQLENDGWVFCQGGEARDQSYLLSLAYHLGKPIPSRVNGALIDELKPIPSNKAKPKSLSAIYGNGSFPLHTDTAYWKTPARFIILHARDVEESGQTTVILDTKRLTYKEDINDLLSRGVFKIVNGRNSFLCSIREKDLVTGKYRFRYDPGCMFPTNQSANEALQKFNEIVSNGVTKEILWKNGDVVILDNWRCLHGRGKASEGFKNRIIERLTIRGE